MVEFLVSQGIRLNRAMEWPDYYDERPGGSAESRAVVAALFDVTELAEWEGRLRPTFVAAPAPVQAASLAFTSDEAADLLADRVDQATARRLQTHTGGWAAGTPTRHLQHKEIVCARKHRRCSLS